MLSLSLIPNKFETEFPKSTFLFHKAFFQTKSHSLQSNAFWCTSSLACFAYGRLKCPIVVPQSIPVFVCFRFRPQNQLQKKVHYYSELSTASAHMFRIMANTTASNEYRNAAVASSLHLQNNIQISSKPLKFLFNDCQPKTIGFRVSTSNLSHLHG